MLGDHNAGSNNEDSWLVIRWLNKTEYFTLLRTKVWTTVQLQIVTATNSVVRSSHREECQTK